MQNKKINNYYLLSGNINEILLFEPLRNSILPTRSHIISIIYLVLRIFIETLRCTLTRKFDLK